jgi:SNF2 family DNA or RNA helicase
MQPEDYLDVPDIIPIVMEQPLTGELLKKYKKLEDQMMLKLSAEENITAMTAATLTNKLLQFSSGNVYDENKNVHHIHDLKIDMLKEIIEDNPNENLLIAYNYKHELDQILKAFPEAVKIDKDPETIERWNRKEIKLLVGNAASFGHGLNLQKGGNILIWYGFTWSLELYQQTVARLHRQGQTEPTKVIHLAVGDVEYKLMKTLAKKDLTQSDLLANLK